ncbi:MAG: hypothetical protein EON56_01315 [Alphaproteobacteria bacterium]|nr:MAG: hypothetical protein EON56_01315 [Alphaproteobacteria bacterium]
MRLSKLALCAIHKRRPLPNELAPGGLRQAKDIDAIDGHGHRTVQVPRRRRWRAGIAGPGAMVHG